MSEFLDCEIEEIEIFKSNLTHAEFIDWFDSSDIKSRYKKWCMRAQGLRCCYCHRYIDSTNNIIWDLEHILSENLYPQFFSTPLNLAIACKDCNGTKSNKDVLSPAITRPPTALPDNPEEYIIPHPWLTNWDTHLKHTNYLIYEYKTDLGKNLIEMCGLNNLALKKADLTPEMVDEAIATKFFQIFKNATPNNLDPESLQRINREVVENSENLRRDALLVPLELELGRMERKAARRLERLKSSPKP